MLQFNLLGLRIDIRCNDKEACGIILANYSAFNSPLTEKTVPDLAYEVSRDDSGFRLLRIDNAAPGGWSGLDAAELVFLLEKDLTLRAQQLRSQLYFMHAAAVLHQDRALLLIGPSGSGKSTTCWGLLHHGCGYLSDELAPMELQHYTVHPYPHALCLKSETAAPYPLPKDILRTGATLHVPIEQLPCPVIRTPIPLGAIFHIEHLGIGHPPALKKLGSAEAGMLIYANALNPLCHAQSGLDAAVDIAQHCRTYRLTTGRLDASVAAILEVLN